MLDFFKEILGESKHSSGEIFMSEQRKAQIATCALFLEVAYSDEVFEESERKQIVKTMQETFGLTDEEVDHLMSLSHEHVQRSISLYEFTDIINKNFDDEQKYSIIKNLWRLIYIDEELHQYEDHFIRRISGNLNISHNQMISAKLSVKKEMGLT